MSKERNLEIGSAITRLAKPWSEVGEPLPSFQVKQVAREAGIQSPNAVAREILRGRVDLPLDGSDSRIRACLVTADGLIVEDLEEGALKSAPYKRAVQRAEYRSRAPGGGPVVKRRIDESSLESQLISLGTGRLQVRFEPWNGEEKRRQKRRRGLKPKSEILSTTSGWVSLCQNPEVLNEVPNDAILSIGFGIDNAVPLRSLSYPVLALELLRERPEITLEMYVATQFAGLRNLSEQVAKINAEQMASMIMEFVRECYPDVACRVSFVATSPLTEERISVISQMARSLQKSKILADFASKRNGRDSLLYMAAHALYIRDPLQINPELYLVSLPPDGREVVMVGSEAEKIMWLARQQIQRDFGAPGKSARQIFTTLGRTPPYFRVDNEPIFSDEITGNWLLQARPEVYRDYASLLVAIGRTMGDVSLTFDSISAKSSARKSFLEKVSIKAALEELNRLSKGDKA